MKSFLQKKKKKNYKGSHQQEVFIFIKYKLCIFICKII